MPPDLLNSDTLTIDSKPCKHLAGNAKSFHNLSVYRVRCQHSVGRTGCVTCARGKESEAKMAAQVVRTISKTRQVWSLGLGSSLSLHKAEHSHLVVKYVQDKKTRPGKSAATTNYWNNNGLKKSPWQTFHQRSRKFTSVYKMRQMYIDSTCCYSAIPWVVLVVMSLMQWSQKRFVSVKHQITDKLVADG